MSRSMRIGRLESVDLVLRAEADAEAIIDAIRLRFLVVRLR